MNAVPHLCLRRWWSGLVRFWALVGWAGAISLEVRLVAATSPLSPNAPALASALQLWFQADALPLSEGAPVLAWPDASGKGRDLTPTRGVRPGGDGVPPSFAADSHINRRAAVRFDGAAGLATSPDNRVAITGDAAATFFLVAWVDPTERGGGLDVVAGVGNPAAAGDPGRPRSFFLQWHRGPEPTWAWAGGWNYDARVAAAVTRRWAGQPVLISVVKAPGPMRSTTRIFLNGEPAGELTGTDTVPELESRGDFGAFLGRPLSWGGAFRGEIAEWVVFNRALDAAEREGVELHLAGKYALPVPLLRQPLPVAFGSEQTNWWAFQPVRRPKVPEVTHPARVRTPIDAFIWQRLEGAGLELSPRADRRTLLRRLALDLTGLPPTEAEWLQFDADTLPGAFERAVERYLASPRYGERWARHWMDVVRYADSAGDNADYPVPEAARYRDYLIDAFNEDLPYARFVQEQLAGDILGASPEGAARREQGIVATGFLALSRRYATAPFEFMHLTIEDAIETTGRTFLGMTFRCARCHDHKYDPVSRQDYYGLYGVFASTRFPYAGSEEFESKKFPRTGFVPLEAPSEVASAEVANTGRLTELRAEVARLERELAGAGTNAAIRQRLESDLRPRRLELKRRERFGAAPGVRVAYAVAEDRPVNSYLQMRGEPAERGPLVMRCAPRFLGGGELPEIPAGASGRRQFAEWLTRPEHPLTARVLVNRVWQHHFGRGLVATPSNFGLRGERPSHPELLDFLADYFVTHGGSIKALHRLILASEVWQQSSDITVGTDRSVANPDRARDLDPANQWLWHFPRRRLDAESLRDAWMFTAGTLRLDRPGPHPFPEFEQWSWTQHNPFKAVYDSPHRSVFLMRQRLQRHPFLALFDAPDANVSTDRRTAATVPLQALYLMNNPFIQMQAAAFGRLAHAVPGRTSSGIRWAIERAWGRPAREAEVTQAERFLEHFTATVGTGDSEGNSPAEAAWTSYARVLLTSNEFLYVD